MPIADFQSKKAEVRFDGGLFSVRALSLFDVTHIVEIHEDAVNEIYSRLQSAEESGQDFTAEMATDITSAALRECPALIARVIAVAADEPDQASTVEKMSITIQFDALKKIGELTFGDINGGKKFFADVKTLIQGMMGRTRINTPAKSRRAA